MKEHLPNEELAILQNEKGDICISITLPAHHLFAEKNAGLVELGNYVREIRNKLSEKYNDDIIDPLLEDVKTLFKQINTTPQTQGIGLFVSANVKKAIHYLLPVQPAITIDRVFNIREILYENSYVQPYTLLLLCKKEVRCFNGILHELTEIENDVFPLKNDTTYEYSPPSRGSSTVGESVLQGFEKDKSAMVDIRVHQFFSKVTGLLKPDTPMILAGEIQDLSSFKQLAKNHYVIAGEIAGNYFHTGLHELGNLAWKSMKQYIDNAKMAMIRYTKEQHGLRLAITGGLNIWRALMDGRGLMLLVEKDYTLPGFFGQKNDDELPIPPSQQFQQLYQVTPDVINLLIYLVFKKGGAVTIVAHDELQELNRLVLITRY